MNKSCILEVPLDRQRDAVTAHVQSMRRERAVVFLCFVDTADQWRRRLGAGDNLFFVDATGHGPPGLRFGPDVLYVDSAVKLELIAMFLERACKRFEAPCVVLEDLAATGAISGIEPTLEFTHLLVNRYGQRDGGIHIFLSDGPTADRMRAGLSGMSRCERLEAP